MRSMRTLRRRVVRWHRYYDRYARAGIVTVTGRGYQIAEAEFSNELVWRRLHRIGCVGFCDDRCPPARQATPPR